MTLPCIVPSSCFKTLHARSKHFAQICNWSVHSACIECTSLNLAGRNCLKFVLFAQCTAHKVLSICKRNQVQQALLGVQGAYSFHLLWWQSIKNMLEGHIRPYCCTESSFCENQFNDCIRLQNIQAANDTWFCKQSWLTISLPLKLIVCCWSWDFALKSFFTSLYVLTKSWITPEQLSFNETLRKQKSTRRYCSLQEGNSGQLVLHYWKGPANLQTNFNDQLGSLRLNWQIRCHNLADYCQFNQDRTKLQRAISDFNLFWEERCLRQWKVWKCGNL